MCITSMPKAIRLNSFFPTRAISGPGTPPGVPACGRRSPGRTEGHDDPTRLRQNGGWRMTPDMAWMNTQNLAFYQFHTLVKERGTVSARNAGWLQKLSAVIAPVLHANEAGCDGLHWLDQ